MDLSFAGSRKCLTRSFHVQLNISVLRKEEIVLGFPGMGASPKRGGGGTNLLFGQNLPKTPSNKEIEPRLARARAQNFTM